MQKKTKKYIALYLAIAFVIGWSVLLYFIPPQEIVRAIGFENGYMIVFIAALFNGLSTVIAGSFYAVLLTFLVGGLDIYMLALLSGVAASIGNCIYFFIGNKSRSALQDYEHGCLDKLTSWFKNMPNLFIPFVAYIYFGFTPLPNELMILLSTVAGYDYKRLLIPLLLGNISLMYLVMKVGQKGAEIV